MKTNKLMALALLSAISIVLTRFISVMIPLFGINAIRISFGDVPIILSGIFFGPLAGALVGIVSDIIGALFLSPYGYFPGFTLSAALVGLIPGLFMKLPRKSNLNFVSLFGIVCITLLIASMFLNTLWISMTAGISYKILLLPRFIANAITIPIESILIYILYKKLIVLKIIKTINNSKNNFQKTDSAKALK